MPAAVTCDGRNCASSARKRCIWSTAAPKRDARVRRSPAREEGVVFHMLRNAVRILGDEQDRVIGMECLRYELGEPDASGRRRPVPISGSEFQMEVDTVIVAIGNDSNPLISQTTEGLAVNKWGNIIVDENGKTSIDGIYAGGDIVLGAATVISPWAKAAAPLRSTHFWPTKPDPSNPSDLSDLSWPT